MDLQTIGKKLAFLRKENKRLKKLVTELQIKNDGLKLTIEEILCSPSTFEHETNRDPVVEILDPDVHIRE